MAKDKEFPNIAALKRAKLENRDYRVVVQAGSDTGTALVLTPHGGGIELHTSLITLAIADNNLDAYLFEGIMRKGNKELHVTSENFDDDVAIEMLKTKRTVVAIHGREDDGDPDTVYLGGLDAELITTIEQRLQQAEFKTKDDGHKFPGIKRSNIVNRGATGKGTQLELPLSLRKVLAKEPALLAKFKDAVREAIHAVDATRRVDGER